MIYIDFSKVSGLMNFGKIFFLLESRMDIGPGGYLWLVKTYAEKFPNDLDETYAWGWDVFFQLRRGIHYEFNVGSLFIPCGDPGHDSVQLVSL